MKQESKNILIKMLKDVGMTVPKREKQVQYIYAATQGMRAVYLKCKKHFTKMLKDVGMVVPKMKGTR